MKNSRLIYTCALMISVIATLGLSSIRVLALLIQFDRSAGYYSYGASMPNAFLWGTVISVIIALLFVVLLRRDFDGVNTEPDTSAVVFASSFIGFIVVGGTLYGMVSGAFGDGALSIIALLLAVPAALYFLMGVALPVKSRDAQIILSALTVLWMFSLIVKTYFMTGVEINNPNKSLLLIALAIVTIHFVSEGRFRIGTEMKLIYVFSGLASLVILGLYTLPNAVLILLRVYPDKIDIIRDLIMFAIFVYILIRMCVVAGMVGDNGSEDDGEDAENTEKLSEYDAYTEEL